MNSLINVLALYWNNYPAFLYGLAILLGSAFSLSFSPCLILPVAFLFFPLATFAGWREKALVGRLFLALFLLVATFFLVGSRYSLTPTPIKGVEGWLLFSPTNVKNVKTPFGKQRLYQGQIKEFHSKELGSDKIFGGSCTIRLADRNSEPLPIADKSYLIKGVLVSAKRQGFYFFSPAPHQRWFPVPYTYSAANWRWEAKNKVKKFIFSKIDQSHSAAFLAGIVTGEFDDRRLSIHFNRFGLQHIMAISGFHFALMAAFAGLFLGVFLSPKRSAAALLIIFSLYCFFVGAIPSVLRAWLAIFFYYLGHLFGRRPFALNSLGLALSAVVLYDPLAITSLGFQFSFAVTAAILLFTGISQNVVLQFFPKRPLKHIVEMDRATQHGYLFIHYLRNTLALTLAVNSVAIPLTLFHFQKFPLMSLLYNIFFPFGVAIVVQLFFVVVILSLIFPFLSSFLYSIVGGAAALLLKFTYNMPITVDFFLYSAAVSFEIILCFLLLLFSIALWFYGKKRECPLEYLV